MKRSLVLFLALLIILSVLPFSAFAEFENTYTNTGDKAVDIIEVARTQLGYMEGSLDGTVQGSNDVTKYGEWYGMPGQPWCAMFISWCANEAEIPTTVIPKHASCDVGMNWFINNGRWKYSTAYGGSYTPKVGDIVYFGIKMSSGFDSTHVGIVYKVDSNNVYSLEGNSAAKVQTVSYKLSSPYVLGYGTPDYASDGVVTYEAGEYITTATTLNVREQPNSDSSTPIIHKLAAGSRVTVTEIENEHWGKIDLEGKQGWISLVYADRIYIVNFDANCEDAENIPTLQEKVQNSPLTLTEDIPTREGYEFLGWAKDHEAAEAEYEPGDRFYDNADTVLYAVWREEGVKSFTVSFDANGGVGAPAPVTKTEGEALTLPETIPTRDGYVFKGWGLTWDSLTTAYRAGGAFTTDADTLLYAVWAEDDYGVIISASEGGLCTRTKEGDTVTVTIRADKDHCISRLSVDGEDVLIISDMNYYTCSFTDGEHTISVSFASNVVGWDEPFCDVAKGKWYYDAVEYCYMNRLMSGVADGYFSPNGTVTRAMFVTILSKVDKADTSGYTEMSFADIVSDKWYSAAVEWAYKSGYTSGIGQTPDGAPTFAPNGEVSRQQLATFLYAYSSLKGIKTDGRADLSSYSDAQSISSWAQESMRWAVHSGLLSGTTLTTLEPKKTASRAMVAVIIRQYVENIAK